jgi:hypothetical protein
MQRNTAVFRNLGGICENLREERVGAFARTVGRAFQTQGERRD